MVVRVKRNCVWVLVCVEKGTEQLRMRVVLKRESLVCNGTHAPPRLAWFSTLTTIPHFPLETMLSFHYSAVCPSLPLRAGGLTIKGGKTREEGKAGKR